MNARIRIFLILLAVAATGYSIEEGDQTLLTKSPPAPVETPGSGSAPRMDATGTLHLSAGSLPEVVAQIEQLIPAMNEIGGSDWTMPNVIFDEAARNRRVPADLRLRKVTPVQAIALVAAAAGCALEPVVAPNETPPSADPLGAAMPATSPAVAGYRIVAGGPPPKNDELSGIGISLVSKDGVITVGEVYPNTPAARSGKIKPGDRLISVAEHRRLPVTLAGMPLEKAANLIRGAAGSTVRLEVQSDDSDAAVSIPIVRERMPLAGPAWPSNTSVHVVSPAGGETLSALPLLPERPNAVLPPSAPPQPSPVNPYGTVASAANPAAAAVRVYAVGSLFSGTEEEAREKEDAFRALVANALLAADANRKSQPSLSYHGRSKALIVKGTPSEHALIQEILAAMKENQTSGTPPPAIRR